MASLFGSEGADFDAAAIVGKVESSFSSDLSFLPLDCLGDLDFDIS